MRNPSRRTAAAVGAGLLTGAVAALILGEYDLSGSVPYVAGVLFGLAVAEVMLTVARHGGTVLAVVAAAISGLGFGWAAWISSGRGVAPVPTSAWVGLVIAVVISAAWVRVPSRRR